VTDEKSRQHHWGFSIAGFGMLIGLISVPGAITVIAALIGATLAGVLGALLAIPVAAGLLLIYEEVVLPRQRQA
jgi:predicted PurR-regulated permease PerM